MYRGLEAGQDEANAGAQSAGHAVRRVRPAQAGRWDRRTEDLINVHIIPSKV